MSSITEIIIYCSSIDESKLKDCPVDLKDVSTFAGGTKRLGPVYAGAINYADLDGFANWFNEGPWLLSDNLVMVINHEHNDAPIVVRYHDKLKYSHGLVGVNNETR